MPFEPLRTDEELPAPAPKTQDADTQMLFGCSSFVGVALVTYLLTVWPHFAFVETHKTLTLLMDLVIGGVPAAAFGAWATRRFGMAAAGGFVGGVLTSSTFLYLRLDQYFALRAVKDAPQPEYPSAWTYLVPLAWFLTSAVVVALFIRREEYAADEPKAQ
ncbi:MAG: hypothetical protein KJZ62_11945 [Fimbriimonadaceae bacterium]|nr:hypothetical protein [Fimbriimonadaceae bacterium]QOJ10806.1 MAG: hypothetical protein HRU74_01595 [Chthonomonadaceae bacterium]RIK01080.1 MAG: hypothetical protein DCC46_03035 [Armatimonadota bacterium]MCC6352121.1 hypothetical protein [Fimbriimonadaceae bacterium]MCL4285799.1 hypothetical protein [Fimbriimonadaceae bacterium]